MKKFKYILLVLPLLFSCDDILEEDISNDIVQIIAPLDDAVIEGNIVQFNWNELDGSDEYRIQIIDDTQFTEVDSLVSGSSFSYTLSTGSYKWRIRGENFAYNSAYTFPTEFSVEPSDDLSNQVVLLQTPSSDFYTNDDDILFTWNAIENAGTYSFVLQKNLGGLQTIHQEDGLTTTSYNAATTLFDEDAEYIWKVKAINDTSETLFSERSIFLDRATPNQPSLVSPSDMATTQTTVSFNWTNGADSGNVQSGLTNTIEISNDIDFNSVVISDATVNNSYQFTFSAAGTYYWKVKAIDDANNESDYSIVRSVIVQ